MKNKSLVAAIFDSFLVITSSRRLYSGGHFGIVGQTGRREDIQQLCANVGCQGCLIQVSLPKKTACDQHHSIQIMRAAALLSLLFNTVHDSMQLFHRTVQVKIWIDE